MTRPSGRRRAPARASSPSTRRRRSCAGRTASIGRLSSRGGSASRRSPRPTFPLWATATLADWGSAGAPSPAPTDPAVITAVPPAVRVRPQCGRREPAVGGSPGRRAGPRSQRRRRLPRRRARSRLQPAPTRALPRRCVVERGPSGDRAQQGRCRHDLDQRMLDVEAIAPAVPIVVLSALTGDHVTDLRDTSRQVRPRSCSGRASASRRSSTHSSGSIAR